MIKESNKNEVWSKWKTFINLILDPWVIILLASTILLVYETTQPENNNIVFYLNLLITLTSGLLGGILANKWTSLTETRVIEVRAKSAIRSLKLILISIGNLENRAHVFLERLNKEHEMYELNRNNFEEIIEKCNILEEEIMSSMEDWTDIIPEVENIKSQIGLLSKIKLDVVEKQLEIKKLREDGELKENVATDNLKLKEQLESKEKELDSLKKKLTAAEFKISSGLLSGITTNSGSFGTSGLSSTLLNYGTSLNSSLYGTSGLTEIALRSYTKKCPICGNQINGTSILCDNCSTTKITTNPK